jgi:hypothetical protein
MDSLKVVVKNYMKLWRNLLCFNIEDQRDLRRVHFGEAKEEAKASTRRSLGDLLAILERLVQDIDRAAKNVSPFENVITNAHI